MSFRIKPSFLPSENTLIDILYLISPSGEQDDCRRTSRRFNSLGYSTKEAQPEEDPSVAARLQRLQNNYEDFGMRRTVEGILVVHDHGHPHILMLQIANAFFKLYVLRMRDGQNRCDTAIIGREII